MRYSLGLFAASAAAAAVRGVPAPGPDGKYTLEAEGIKAKVCDILAAIEHRISISVLVYFLMDF